MKKESLVKARETREANKDKYASQSIQIGGLNLRRIDDYNWGIVKKQSGKEDEVSYYGRLIDSLRAIPHKLLDDGEKRDLKQILDQVEAIQKEIDRMFNMKFDHFQPTEGE